MTSQNRAANIWSRLPIVLRAIISGLLVADTFTARPITETGIDQSFLIACAVFTTSLLIVLLAISKLRQKSPSTG
jgi:formate/nitrite transporter FocA (FNT family)